MRSALIFGYTFCTIAFNFIINLQTFDLNKQLYFKQGKKYVKNIILNVTLQLY